MMKHIRINPLFLLAAALAFRMHCLSSFVITYLSLIVHEGIHLWFLCKHKIPIRKISLEPFGISIQTERKLPENPIVYLSAPIGNLLIAVCLMLCNLHWKNPLLSQWILANFSLGLINLLPVLPLDGGRALILLVAKKLGKQEAQKRIQQVSILVCIPITAGMIMLFLNTGGSFGIMLILVFICYTVLSGNRLWEYKKLHQSAFRTAKGNFSDTVCVEHLGVQWNYPAQKLLKVFQGDKYYVINVFRDGILLKTVTETQILNRVLMSEGNILVSEC